MAILGEVHPTVVKNYGLAKRTYAAQIDVEGLYEKVSFARKYQGIPKYPAVSRDLSLVMDRSVRAGQIEEIIESCGGKLLEHYELFDIYEGEQVGAGRKSLAYTVRFRASDRTLEDGDVTPIMEKIVKKLGEIDVFLRS